MRCYCARHGSSGSLLCCFRHLLPFPHKKLAGRRLRLSKHFEQPYMRGTELGNDESRLADSELCDARSTSHLAREVQSAAFQVLRAIGVVMTDAARPRTLHFERRAQSTERKNKSDCGAETPRSKENPTSSMFACVSVRPTAGMCEWQLSGTSTPSIAPGE